ncbi:MAG: hypothetical protein WKG07_34215 [Hymenobacter sp.]
MVRLPNKVVMTLVVRDAAAAAPAAAVPPRFAGGPPRGLHQTGRRGG